MTATLPCPRLGRETSEPVERALSCLDAIAPPWYKTPGMARRRSMMLPQLAMNLGPDRPPWRFSRLVLRSPHFERILQQLEFVRPFFPELGALTIRVGLVRKPGILGWGSLDPDAPGVWVRPRRQDSFTIAHEFTHLLQARGLVPRGERSCDLFALARSPLLVDHPPGYLRLPMALRRLRRLDAAHGTLLHRAACRALEARGRGDRRYIQNFERDIAQGWSANEAPPRALESHA